MSSVTQLSFLNAYLSSHGAEPVNLDQFRYLAGSTATGVDRQKIGRRLTNLLNLNVDLSWYTRYRSEENPDLGAIFKGPFNILNEPAIPLNDTDTPPTTVVPPPPIWHDKAGNAVSQPLAGVIDPENPGGANVSGSQ